jgi:DNA-binding GntR family transcriptional regulator
MNSSNISGLTAPPNRTLGDHVTQRLREAILSGQLRPGQRVVEREIAETMQMSRGPVRDALKELESERLVVRYPHKGTFVAWLTLRDAEEIYSLREALENLALDYAIRYATDQQLDELDRIVNAMAAQGEQGYTQFEATDLDLEFHDTLHRISGHTRVLGAWRALRSQVRMLILSHRMRQPSDFRDRGIKWHQRLAAAVRQRDITVAREVLHQHLASSFQTVAASFAQNAQQDQRSEAANLA